LSALHWLAARGAAVFVPLSHSRDYDVVADFGQGPLRVQVKTSTQRAKGRWTVAVCTRGGNQSWSGLVKRLDPFRYDYLFVLVGDGRRWFIPSTAVGGETCIVVGGQCYGEYEIERDPVGLCELHPAANGAASLGLVPPFNARSS
jgi:hypothetical protein